MVLEAEAQSGVNDYEKNSDVYGSQGKEAETLGKELESIYQASQVPYPLWACFQTNL